MASIKNISTEEYGGGYNKSKPLKGNIFMVVLYGTYPPTFILVEDL